MKIETKFNLGDKVYKIWFTREAVRIPCPVCGGEPDFETKTGDVVKCSNCTHAEYHGHPKGTIQQYKDSAWIVDALLTIGKVEVSLYAHEGGEGGSMFSNMVAGEHHKDKETYMCWETGVGSGTNHNVKDLFATREEAEIECAIRNKG